MNFVFSQHAKDQAEARFPGVDLKNELKTAIEIGGQFGRIAKAYLTDSDAVIIVENNTIKTVMPKVMYFANMAKFNSTIGIHPVLLPSAPKKSKKNEVKTSVKKPDPVKTSEAEDREAADRRSKQKREAEWEILFLEIAKKDLENDILANQFCHETRKKRAAPLKEQGYSSAARDYYEKIYIGLYLEYKKIKH